MITTIQGVTLIGTAHVSKQSAKLVEKTVKELSPDIVAIELDSMRLQSLLDKHNGKTPKRTQNMKLIRQVGMFGFLFLKISGFLQQKLGKSLQIDPGVDMLAGVLISKELQIPLALVDRPILQTISQFKKIPFFQKISMAKRMVFSKMDFEKRKDLATKLQKGKLDAQVITEVIGQIKEEVPELYNILIHQRNVYMANKIIQLRKKGLKDIVLVIGAGHLPGIQEILEKELQKIEIPNEVKMSFKLE